jgi:hypothetical protein
MQLASTTSAHSGNGYASIALRAEAYSKLRAAFMESDGFIGENIWMTGVPLEVVEGINSATSNTEVVASWQRYLASVVLKNPLH